jgi:hypothetical protein
VTDCYLLRLPLAGGSSIAVELKRRVLIREVNARIREVSDRFGTPEGSYRLLCECGRGDCEERFEVPVAEYDDLRLRNEFLVCESHEAKPVAPVAVMAAAIPAEPLRMRYEPEAGLEPATSSLQERCSTS